MNDFDRRVRAIAGGEFRSCSIETIQVNLGRRCNQSCAHCHINASPKRTETMNWPTMASIVDAAQSARCRLVDLTGGSPELNPHFRRFVEALHHEKLKVQVRTNLTVFHEPGLDTTPEFLRDNAVQLVASLPCYLEENVDAQRGPRAYEKSIESIRQLNALGYGSDPSLALDLVYNPGGPFLPPDQADLEAAYKQELSDRFGIVFTSLLTITNMPIGRFRTTLRKKEGEEEYGQLLKDSFNPDTVDRLMCRRQISVGWDGRLYDCDFNLALGMSVDHGAPNHIESFDPHALAGRRIVTGEHCFGCTAGAGSSCGGALA